MAAIDDLTELVERAAAAERTALASQWKEGPDVEKLAGKVRGNAELIRAELAGDSTSEPPSARQLSARWARLRQAYLELGAQQDVAAQPVTPEADATQRTPSREGRLSPATAAQVERDAVAAVALWPGWH